MFPYIVADIGGTNARFALVTGRDGDQFQIENIHIFKGKNFSTFEETLQAYIYSRQGESPTGVCGAIAAPIRGDQVAMTNLSWSFSQDAIKKAFNLNVFAAINDYTSVAVATTRLREQDLLNLVPGTRSMVSNKAVLGPGTGLGVGGLVYLNDGSWQDISSEGGHATLGPATPFEAEVISAAIKQHGYVSAETCVSGPGLVNLYSAISLVRDQQIEALQPKDVSRRALEGSDPTCVDALSLFCAFLGTISSNLALTYGAHGGVYITGGVVPRFVEFLKQSDFEARFRDKGVMSHFVKDIPVDLVTYSETAYLGAAAWLEQRMAH